MQDTRVTCDAAPYFEDVSFPEADVHVMSAERTFWEKATAAHVFCLKGGEPKAERFSRHWYDLVQLDEAEVVEAALGDRDLAERVAEWKKFSYREKDSAGVVINYSEAVRGKLCLIPNAEGESSLRADYDKMRAAGLLEPEAPSFDEVMVRCRKIQERANKGF
jgi:hypothetical protein